MGRGVAPTTPLKTAGAPPIAPPSTGDAVGDGETVSAGGAVGNGRIVTGARVGDAVAEDTAVGAAADVGRGVEDATVDSAVGVGEVVGGRAVETGVGVGRGVVVGRIVGNGVVVCSAVGDGWTLGDCEVAMPAAAAALQMYVSVQAAHTDEDYSDVVRLMHDLAHGAGRTTTSDRCDAPYCLSDAVRCAALAAFQTPGARPRSPLPIRLPSRWIRWTPGQVPPRCAAPLE